MPSLSQPIAAAIGVASRSRAARRVNAVGDKIFAAVAWLSGVFVLLLLGAIIVSLLLGGLPALRLGVRFLTSTQWDPVRQSFGAAVPIFGTLVTSVLAVVMAVPLAFGIAFYLTELAPTWLRGPVGAAVELLAAIPSIIFGMWGFFAMAPVLGQHVEPWAIDTLGKLPVAGSLFQGPPYGTGLFAGALILAVMILPFIAATMRDIFMAVPPIYKESAYAVGCTTWEVTRLIVLPATRSSVVGSIMLGLGRALGETMAVTFVIGNTNRIATTLFGPGNTIASLVALEFSESQAGSLKLSALMALGFILFVISFVVLAASRLVLRPSAARFGA
jgi:phosphate transport system permease protein